MRDGVFTLNSAIPAGNGPAEHQYRRLAIHRSQFEDLAEDAAEVTIPKLFPREGQQLHTFTPWHSQPGMGVSNLASRLLLSLFPPQLPFFSLEPSEAALLEAKQEGATDEQIAAIKDEVSRYLQQATRLISSNLSRDKFRSKIHLALLHVIVSGNACIDLTGKKGIGVHTLRDFAVQRDASDNLLAVITCKKMSLAAVPEDIQQQYMMESPHLTEAESFNPVEHQVNVYTVMRRSDDGMQWNTHQEVESFRVDGSDGTFPIDAPPLIPVRFRPVAGYAYGTGHIDDLIGDIRTLHTLQRSLTIAAEESAKVYWVKRPGSMIQSKDLQKPTGTILIGEPGDLTAVRADKGSDMAAAAGQLATVEARLGQAMLSSSPRNAERVTAAEIRLISNQLEQALGGAYSALAAEVQAPLANSYLLRAQRQNEMPTFSRSDLDVRPTTGLDALGRNTEAQNYSLFVQEMAQLLGPEAVTRFVRVPSLVTALARSFNIDPATVRSQEEVDKIQAEQQQAAEAQAAAGPVAGALAQNLSNQGPP